MTILGLAESFRTMNRLFGKFIRQGHDILKQSLLKVSNLLYLNLGSISSIVWKLCDFRQRNNFGHFYAVFSTQLSTEREIFDSDESEPDLNAKISRNGYDDEKRIVSKLSKISKQNIISTNYRLESRFCQNFMSLSLILSEK